LKSLFALAKDHHELLVKYEAKLLPLHPDAYLTAYCATVDRLIALRGRDNYRAAVRYLQAIRQIYRSVLNQPKEWDHYFNRLKAGTKTLRALHEELQRL
jgi:uncharacterized Zn finger protein